MLAGWVEMWWSDIQFKSQEISSVMQLHRINTGGIRDTLNLQGMSDSRRIE